MRVTSSLLCLGPQCEPWSRDARANTDGALGTSSPGGLQGRGRILAKQQKKLKSPRFQAGHMQMFSSHKLQRKWNFESIALVEKLTVLS